MRRLCIGLVLLLLGALALSPLVAALELDRVPGDIVFHWGNTQVSIPVAYSLCASVGMALFYKIMKR
jgi:hypothetical protein